MTALFHTVLFVHFLGPAALIGGAAAARRRRAEERARERIADGPLYVLLGLATAEVAVAVF